MTYDYDMIAIGGGSAGLVASGMSALLGAKTALVEEHRLGGDCTWSGCVPSKTLLRVAKIAHQMRTADRYGFASLTLDVPFERVMEHVRAVRRHVYEDADAPPNLEKLGVDVIEGKAHFTDPHTIEIQSCSGQLRLLTSRYFVIATGTKPRSPGFSALCLNNDTLFEQTSQPKRLLVIGGGPVGVEMAQAFQRLGTSVTLVAPGDHILPKDDPELTGMLQQSLVQDGISIMLGHRVTALDRHPEGLLATVDDGRITLCDAALAAIGREPNVAHLALENAGVSAGRQGIEIDNHCRTSQRHIYASGDVTGRYLFTHMAEHMSKIAVTNAILRWPKTLDDKHVVWCTFTEPELARLAESEQNLCKRGQKHTVYRFPFTKLDRAITEGDTTGLVKVMAGRSGHILGATILGVNAGEMISEYALAMRHGLRIAQISDTIHPYPTYMLGNRLAADKWYTRQLDNPLLGVLGKLLGYRGKRKGAAAL